MRLLERLAEFLGLVPIRVERSSFDVQADALLEEMRRNPEACRRLGEAMRACRITTEEASANVRRLTGSTGRTVEIDWKP